jgi:DNA-binding GntR family transcriptional regulator
VSTGDERSYLARARELLDRTSRADKVAAILRGWIIEGRYPPGTRLSEEELTLALGISRNSLREAFRLLVHEKLLEHELNKGVSVRILDIDDLRDLYQVRRVIECAAVRSVTEVPAGALDRLRAAVIDAQRAAQEGRWPDVGTANLRFHEAIVSLIGSPRIDEQMSRVWAEIRLVWQVIDDPRTIFERYVPRNQQIFDLLAGGDLAAAEKAIEAYMVEAEEQFVAAYAEAAHR